MPTVGSATNPHVHAAYLARRDQFIKSPSHIAQPLEVARGLIWREINELPEKLAEGSDEAIYRFNLGQIAVRLEDGWLNNVGEVIRIIEGSSDEDLKLRVGDSFAIVKEAVLILQVDDEYGSLPTVVIVSK